LVENRGIDMPAISMFYGIIIYMYFMDNKQHNTPHIHVKYQEHEVIVAIPRQRVGRQHSKCKNETSASLDRIT
jgi:hypothetical protein